MYQVQVEADQACVNNDHHQVEADQAFVSNDHHQVEAAS